MNEPQPPTIPALQIDGLTYAFKRQVAVNNVSLTVMPQSIHGFVGPNGAGKTTTLKVVATLLRPRIGRVHIFGMDIVRQIKHVRRRIGFMPDHFTLYRNMTVFEYLDFFAAAYGLVLHERNRVIDDVLNLTDMTGRRDSLTKSLSRGMQQRLSLARVLVHDPDLLLLDEPASGLDPRARIELMEVLRELCRMGKTIFISSHILSELGTLCDSVTIIDRGQVRFSGVMSDLLASQDTRAGYVLMLREAHEELAQRLLDVDGVEGVGPIDGKPGYRVMFDAGRTDANTILQTAITSGAQIAAFHPDENRLNQAFMELTQPGLST